VGEEEPAQGGRSQAAFKVGVVEIVAGEVTELLGGVLVLAAGEARNWREGFGSGRLALGALFIKLLITMVTTKNVFAVLDQEVESFDCGDEGKRSLVFEVFTSHVEQIREIGIAESGTRRV